MTTRRVPRIARRRPQARSRGLPANDDASSRRRKRNIAPRRARTAAENLTWKTFLKKGLLAESITLCAVRHCPSLARVTSTRPSSSHRLSKLVAILLRKLFHFRHI
ncbi:hypothetical protein X777_13177 [Ooceraea biroi]|uniref:Uncharacterized protein n=1 Tax=Ooceraea biroi TaxID=2015173 RepID=A0A026VZ01_OOCBI|nr:hypothetical protein X777_13177 [Ooceraea biroi]